MSQIPLRSVRLNARPATTLESFVGTAGEIFYDSTNQTLRVYPGNIAAGKILADRDWVNSTIGAIGSSSLVNGTRTVSLSTAGSLTIPGDIRSDSNINIDINLSDSTLRRWQFGEDGNLVVPGDINLSGGTISQYSQNGLTGLKLVANADQGQNVTIMGTGNNTFPILNYVGTTLSGITIGTPEGDWNFMNGNLTIPGDIRSDSNINIDINLADSTLRRWQFGEDGHLTLPSGGNISEGGGLTGAIRLTPAGGANANQALLIYPTAQGEGDHIHLTAGGGSTELYLGDDDHFVKLTSDGFVVIKTDDGVSGKVWGFSPDGTTSIPGDIKSDSNINIDINLSDSTLRRWQFGEDGNLTLPAGGNILNSSGQSYVDGVTSISTSVTTGIFSDASGDYQYGTLSYDYAVNGVTSGGFSIEYSRPLVGGNVDINVGNAVVNGDLTLSGDIKSNGNINIDINLADSTLRRWQFGEDGQLTFPDGGNLRVSGIPASSIGLAGDTAGMLAFNASYAYYCTANYDGVTNIWRRTAHDVATW